MTTSCTDALEMAAVLMGIGFGDEIIIPSFTFVSTANPFLLRGAKTVFCDSSSENPNIDVSQIEKLITSKTKAIAVVHYAGIACDMEKIMSIANQHNLMVIEDAAQAIDSYHNQKPLGSFGHFSAFSFHETKNISSGEGGMLVINDASYLKKAEIIWEKGTNRSAFFKGEVDKYNWVDVGSSFLPSEITTALLFAQLESLRIIQEKRKRVWNTYYASLKELEERKLLFLPLVPSYATNNAQIFYILLDSISQRDAMIAHLKKHNISATFHYQSLHKSPFYTSSTNEAIDLPNSDKYTNCLLRLPLHYYLGEEDVAFVVEKVKEFWTK